MLANVDVRHIYNRNRNEYSINKKPRITLFINKLQVKNSSKFFTFTLKVVISIAWVLINCKRIKSQVMIVQMHPNEFMI